MADLMWFFLEAIVRVILTLVGVAAGLVALAITAVIAFIVMTWRRSRIRGDEE